MLSSYYDEFGMAKCFYFMLDPVDSIFRVEIAMSQLPGRAGKYSAVR